jgi:hypothetical protein
MYYVIKVVAFFLQKKVQKQPQKCMPFKGLPRLLAAKGSRRASYYCFYPRVQAVYRRVYNLLCCWGVVVDSVELSIKIIKHDLIYDQTCSDMFRLVQTRSNLI